MGKIEVLSIKEMIMKHNVLFVFWIWKIFLIFAVYKFRIFYFYRYQKTRPQENAEFKDDLRRKNAK